MAKNRYFRTAFFSLFTGVVLVGLTLLANPENARRLHFLAIGQDPPPLISPNVAIAPDSHDTDHSKTQTTAKQVNEIKEISVSEPALLPEHEETPLNLNDQEQEQDQDQDQEQEQEQEQAVLKESNPETYLDEPEEIIVEVDTTELDKRIGHLDEQIIRLQDVENKQRDLLTKSEELYSNVQNQNLLDQEPQEEESLELTEPADKDPFSDGPILEANLETQSEEESTFVEEETIDNSESEPELENQNSEPVLIARKDETDSSIIYLKFENAEIRQVCKLLAEVSQSVIFVSPELTGKLTKEYRIHDLEEALTMILPALGYTFEREENRVYIMPVEMLRKLSQNPDLRESERAKLINVREEHVQTEKDEPFINKINPGLSPPEDKGVYTLIDHQKSGDQKMGDDQLDKPTQELFAGKSLFQDEQGPVFKPEQKLVQPNSGVVQASYSQKPNAPLPKRTHTPRLFQPKQVVKTVPEKLFLEPATNRPVNQQMQPVSRQAPRQYSSRNQFTPRFNPQQSRSQYPVQLRHPQTRYPQRKPVSMPIITVKPF